MRAGKLDRVIRILTTTYEDDGYGGQVPVTTERATLRAQIIDQSTDEYMKSYGQTTEHVRVFRTRWLDGVTPEDAIEFDGDQFGIEQIKEIGRRRGLELRCKRYGSGT